MKLRTLIILTVLFALIGGIAGGVLGLSEQIFGTDLTEGMNLPNPQSAEDRLVDNFVKEQEGLHPEGLKEPTVSGLYGEEEAIPTKPVTETPKAEEPKEPEKKPTETAPPAPPAGTSQGTVQAPSGLNLRESPSTTATILGSLDNNATVTILTSQDGWYQVKTSDGKTGWASAEFIKKGE